MIIIGIDQSYTETGICIIQNEKIIKYFSIKFNGCNNTEKRNKIRERLDTILCKLYKYQDDIKVICERIRTFTNGNSLRPQYLISTGALIATIVDCAYKHQVKTYSVDTRSWMSKVIGSAVKGKSKSNLEFSSKTVKPSVDFVLKKYKIDVSYKTKTGLTRYNDNVSDAICIAFYGFVKNPLLKLEDK